MLSHATRGREARHAPDAVKSQHYQTEEAERLTLAGICAGGVSDAVKSVMGSSLVLVRRTSPSSQLHE